MKLKTEKCMKIICTTKLSNIKKEELVHDIVHCLAAPPADAVAGKALGAFAAALKESDSVAIVRYEVLSLFQNCMKLNDFLILTVIGIGC